jgi:membrane-bound lytic murein transglycosylase D
MSQIPRYDNVTHVIELGDSLSSLALKYKTTTKDIRKQNGLASDTIIIGQSLEIRSLSKSSMSAEIRKLSYRVKKGDSLALIAKRFSLKVSDITRWNKISSKQYIQPGQRLTLLINPRLI